MNKYSILISLKEVNNYDQLLEGGFSGTIKSRREVFQI